MFKEDRLYTFLDWVVPVTFILSFFECYLSMWHLATYVKFLSILVTVYLLITGHFKKNQDLFFVFYILIIFSFIQYLYNGRPIECLSSDFFNMVPAMLFFYVGLNAPRNNRDFYNNMMYVGAAVLLCGLFCYVTTPGWYVNSIRDAINSSALSVVRETSESMLETLRFSGFFEDSYPVSLLSVFIVAIALFNYYRIDKKVKYSFICFAISFVAAIFCMHRVSIASAIAIYIVFLSYQIKEGKFKKFLKVFCIIAIGVVLLSAIIEPVRERISNVWDMVANRTEDMSFSQAYNERQGLSRKLMAQWSYPIFGHGLGSGGPTSRFMGYGGVTDAAYTKMLFENGIVGIGLFAMMIISSCVRGLKYLKYYITELSIIVFICLAMTGSNSLSQAYLYIIPFWYALGRIWNNSYLAHAQKDRIYI